MFFVRDRNQAMLILLIVFVVDAFVVLPLVSRLYGCGHCPQKADCPWMIKSHYPRSVNTVATGLVEDETQVKQKENP